MNRRIIAFLMATLICLTVVLPVGATEPNETYETDGIIREQISDDANEAPDLHESQEPGDIKEEPAEADDEEDPVSDTGIPAGAALYNDTSETTPYVISTAADMEAFIEAVLVKEAYDAHAVLHGDIDLSEVNGGSWTPLGSEQNPYTGIFDGKGKTIRNLNLSGVTEYAGLFGYTKDAIIKNITVSVKDTNFSGESQSGVLIGHAAGTTIENCHVTGGITFTAANPERVGGLVGMMGESEILRYNPDKGHEESAGQNLSSITGSSVSGPVVFDPGAELDMVGGLVGLANAGAIEECKITGDFSFSGAKLTDVGGLVGFASYSTGSVIIEEETHYSYATVRFIGNRIDADLNFTSAESMTNTGGIAGYAEGAEIYGSIVPGNITFAGETMENIGGITGSLVTHHFDAHNGNVESMESTIAAVGNEVTGTLRFRSDTGMENVGGIAGLVFPNSYHFSYYGEGNTMLVRALVNENTVSGDLYVTGDGAVENFGGIMGAAISSGLPTVGQHTGFLNIGTIVEGNTVSGSLDIDINGAVIGFGGLTAFTPLSRIDGLYTCFKSIGDNAVSAAIQILAEHVSGAGGLIGSAENTEMDTLSEMRFAGSLDITTVDGANSVALGFGTVSLQRDMSDIKVSGDLDVHADANIYDIGLLAGYLSGIEDRDLMEMTEITGDGYDISGNMNLSAGGDANSIGVLAGKAFGTVTIQGFLLDSNIALTAEEASAVGGYVGSIDEQVGFADCGFTGNIAIRAETNIQGVGGIFGRNYSSGIFAVDRCFSTADITLTMESDGAVYGVGGLLGGGDDSAMVGQGMTNSFAHGTLAILPGGNEVTAYQIGGLAGAVPAGIYRDSESRESEDRLDTPVLYNCYATTSLVLAGVHIEGQVGGLAGSYTYDDDEEIGRTFENCYYAGDILGAAGKSDVAGLIIGLDEYAPPASGDRFVNCYYDADKAANAVSDGIDGLPALYFAVTDEPTAMKTAEMTRENVANESVFDNGAGGHNFRYMEGFDFTENTGAWIWTANNADVGYYPQLRIFAGSADSGISAASLFSTETTAWYHGEYNGNGGKTASGVTHDCAWHEYESVLSAPQPVFMKNGTNVDGWADSKTNTYYPYQDTGIILKDDMLLLAQYGKTTFRVTYNANGGAGTVSDAKAYYDGAAATVLPNGFTHSRFVFSHWNTKSNDSGTSYHPEDTFAVRENTTLYAIWKDDREPPISLNDEDHIAYILGFPDNSVQADGYLTRAQAAVMFYRLTAADDKDTAFTTNLSDVKTHHWYYREVAYLTHYGIIEGYEDGTFRANKHITRAEFAVLAARYDALVVTDTNQFTDVTVNHWAIAEINSAAAKGWIDGYEDGTFRPDRNIKRGEAAAMINRVLSRKILLEDLPEGIHVYTDIKSGHWAYCDIMEASHEHEYERKSEDGAEEIWTSFQYGGE